MTISSQASSPHDSFTRFPCRRQGGAVDLLVDQLDQVAGGAMDEVVNRIRQILDDVALAGGDLTDVLPRLAEEYHSIDITALAGLMGAAMANANLSGRVEVADADSR